MNSNEGRSETDGRPFAGNRGRMGDRRLIPFGDQNFSKRKSSSNNSIHWFVIPWKTWGTKYCASEKGFIRFPLVIFLEKWQDGLGDRNSFRKAIAKGDGRWAL
jgi:hypothetical protein